MESNFDREIEDSTSGVSEEEDDEGFVVGEKGIPFFRVDLDEKHIGPCKTLIITDGMQASAYALNYLLPINSEVIGKVEKESKASSSDIEFWGLRSKKPEPSSFFEVSNQVLLCISSPNLVPEDFYSFSSAVINRFSKDTSVVILTASAVSHFKSDTHPNDIPTPLIRTLSTATFLVSSKYAKLEQPNILAGVAAGMLTICEVKGVAAAVCVVYSPSLNLDMSMKKSFSDFLLTCEGTRSLAVNSSARLSSVDACVKTGNLYI